MNNRRPLYGFNVNVKALGLVSSKTAPYGPLEEIARLLVERDDTEYTVLCTPLALELWTPLPPSLEVDFQIRNRSRGPVQPLHSDNSF